MSIDRTTKVLNRVNKYLAIMRYEYGSKEQLVRLDILNNYYATLIKKPSEEKVVFTLETAEQLSTSLKLPLKVKGIFLTEGRPQKKYYTKESLEVSVLNPFNQHFPICYDHKNKETEKIIGVVTKIWYDHTINGLRWKGHINSETAARNVMDNVISQVSATIYSIGEYTDEYGLVGNELTYKELSLVWEGAEPNNVIMVDN